MESVTPLASTSYKKPIIGILTAAIVESMIVGVTTPLNVEASRSNTNATTSSPVSAPVNNTNATTSYCSPVNNTNATTSSPVSAPVNNTQAGKLKVVSSVAPVTNIIKNIGGDRIELTGIVPEGVNSHTFELTPSDAILVNDADLVIINGLHLETPFESVVEAAGRPDLQLLKLGDNTITRDQWIFDFSFPEEEGDPNPHLWLNAANAMKYAELVCSKLVEMDPTNADYYSANLVRYLGLLRQLDEGISQAVQTIPVEYRKLLTYHDSWAYFAPRYNMTVIGAVQASDFGEPTAQDVARLIDQIRTENVPAIFASEVFPTQVVDQIAREGNVQVVETLSDDDLPGDPGVPENSYVGMMLENMGTMVTALGGNSTALDGINPSDTYMTP